MSKEQVKHATIHDEIESEISNMSVTRRSPWPRMGWKIIALLILAGVGLWAAWPNPHVGPIHTASASAR